MWIDIDDDLTVHDGSDMTSLSVRAAQDLSAIDERLRAADAGHADVSAAWLRISWLRDRLRASLGGDDFATFDAMIAFAEQHGWTDRDVRHVRAHVEAPAGS